MQISGHGKVDHLAKLLLGIQETENPGGRQATTRTQGAKDEVQISAQAKELQRIRELADQPDSGRTEHVERIKRALESGTYDVTGRAVGDALIKQILTDAIL